MSEKQRQWAMAAVIVAYMLSFFHRFAPAGIASELAAAFQTSATSLGVLAASYFYVYTLMQVPTGILADTVGPKRLLVGGALTATAGSVLFAIAGSLDMAIVGRTLIGLGVSVTFIAMLKLIALWYDERRFASLVGLALLLGNLGSVLAGAPLTAVAQAIGWRNVFFLAALLSLLTALAFWFGIDEKRQERHLAFDRTLILGGLARILRNPATWPPLLTNFGISGSFFAFAGLWATPYLSRVHGMTANVAGQHLSLYFASFAIGCLLIGTLSDRLGRRKPALIGSAIGYFALWLVWLAAIPLPPTATYPLFALMGLFTAAFTLSWACAKEVNPPELSGMSTSVVNMGGFLASALLQPAIGRIMDWSWQGGVDGGVRVYDTVDFQLGLALPAAAALLGLIASVFIRETHGRNIWRKAAP